MHRHSIIAYSPIQHCQLVCNDFSLPVSWQKLSKVTPNGLSSSYMRYDLQRQPAYNNNLSGPRLLTMAFCLAYHIFQNQVAYSGDQSGTCCLQLWSTCSCSISSIALWCNSSQMYFFNKEQFNKCAYVIEIAFSNEFVFYM